jgi:hypothetical protein
MAWMMLGCLAAAALSGAGASDADEKTTLRDSWTFAPGAGEIKVAVDNIDGSIRVNAHEGRTVQLVADRTVRAESPARIESAKDEVQLKITKQDALYEAYVDAPWRCKDGHRERSWDSPGYTVRYDFELSVPVDAKLFLRTINHGEIRVDGIRGDYDVNNINGGIEMLEISGSGRAYALNGRLRVVFRQNPSRDSYFGSLNGDVDLFFVSGLAADLRLKTFNGEIFTDFDVTPLPGGPVTRESRGGKYVYRADRFYGVRIGQGGPEIKLDGFNGDIRIHERNR